jgi:pilus assembly protein CpaB
MRLVSILIVLGAVVLAGAIFFIAPRFMGGGQQAQQAQPQVVRIAAQDVLVAAHNLPAGQVLKLEDVKWQRWPEEALDSNFMVREKGADPQKTAVGMVVLHGIEAGVPITAQRLLKPGDASFLSAALSPGLRAVTIKVDPISAEAGFILPQDHVDVVLEEHFPIVVSQTVANASQNLPQITTRDAATVILRNVKVLAINQVTQDIDSKPNPAPATATLEVDLQQAEKLDVAATLGTLSLVLRSHTLPARPEPEGASPTVEDFQASPYRAAVLQQIYGNLAASEQAANPTVPESDGLRVYHGTTLAAGTPGAAAGTKR